MRNSVIAAVACLSSMLAMARTTYTWNRAGSGGWQSASQYLLDDGVTAATSAPVANDVIVVPEGVTVEIATDADAAFVNTLGGVQLLAESSKFVFNQPSAIQWRCPVFGDGVMVKRTSATVEFLPNTQTDLYPKKYSGFSAYLTWGGLVVEKGTIKMPQTLTGVYSMGPVTLSNDTVFVLSPNSTSQLAALNGYGMVTSPAPASAKQNVQVGYANWDSSKWNVSRFYGMLAGEGMKWSSPGTVYLHNEASSFAGTVIQWGRYDEVHPWGTLCVPKIGMSGKPSSIGTYGTIEFRSSGSLLYLGNGETTDKIVYWRAQEAPQTIIDAGAKGGVTFTGAWSQYGASSDADCRMGRLLLTGSNTAPCVITGRISAQMSFNGTNYTTYITKSGSGTWKFANDTNRQRGALAVTDGTLQFTSIAEKGVECALGTSTILYEDVFGPRDESRAVNYAFLLGGTGAIPTMEYTGGKVARCSTRPLALTGSGGRFSSSGTGSHLKFAKVHSHDTGKKTLTLGGDSAGFNMISDIAPGKGSVALAKDGPGRWALRGTNVISGTLDVCGGTLEVWDGYAPTWYRLVIKSMHYGTLAAGSPAYTLEFAMYDSAGSNRVAGLSYHLPPAIASGTTSGWVQPASASSLAEGEALFHSASGCDVYHYTTAAQVFENLFDGTTGNYWRMLVRSMPTTSDDPSKYVYVVMRLPAGLPPLVRYDMVIGKITSGEAIGKFAIECSTDGENWMPITDDVTVSTPTSNWLSGDAFAAGHPYRPGCGLSVNDTFAEDGASHVMDHVDSVRVAPSAKLVARGARKTAAALTIDCSAGVGSIEGFDFAADGYIDLVNVPPGNGALTLPASLSGVSAESLSRLNAYQVTANGSPCRRIVRITESSITVTPRGLVVVVQ